MAMTWQTAVAVAIGSGLGGVGRVWATVLATRWLGEALPWGTLGVNLLGSLAIGLVAGLSEGGARFAGQPLVRDFFLLGLFGGFTTFSSFSLQTLNLLRDGEVARAAVYVAASAGLCVAAAALGYGAGVQLQR
jgi:CrcB protein